MSSLRRISEIALLLLTAFGLVTPQSGYNCGDLPAGTETLGSICYGYATVRALGEPRYTAIWKFRPNYGWMHPEYFNGPLSGDIRLGDVVAWGPEGDVPLGPHNAHVAYVASVQTANIPSGDVQLARNGVVRDMSVPTPIAQFDKIRLDHVDGPGAGPAHDILMSTVHDDKVERGHVYRGIYRVRPEKLCLITFTTNLGGLFLELGKDQDGNFVNSEPVPVERGAVWNAFIPARAPLTQKIDTDEYIFNANQGWWKTSVVPPIHKTYDPVVEVDVGHYHETYTAYYNNGGPSSGEYVTFENRSDTIGIGSIVMVNGKPRFSNPRTDPIILGAYATAIQHIFIGRVHYTFLYWKSGNTVVSSDLIFTPQAAGNYIAYYRFDYVVPPSDISFNQNPGGGTRIAWTKIEGQLVDQIQVWRQVRQDKQLVETANVIATLSPNETQYVDYGYTPASGWTECIVDYDIRTRYRVNNTYSSASWINMFAETDILPAARQDEPDPFATNSPHQLNLSAYPNPFNSSTQITCVVKTRSYVEIGVFDIEGRLVIRLQEGVLEPGVHRRAWSGRNESGISVPSGIYFARLVALDEAGGQTTRLIQKLVLVK